MANPLTSGEVPDKLKTQNVLQQGDSYEEDDFLEEDDDGGSRKRLPAGSSDNEEKNKKGKQAVLIAVIIAVFVGVGLIVMMAMSLRGRSEEPDEIYDDTQYTDVDGEQIPIDPDTGEPLWTPDPPFAYTSEELTQLRAAGYTGDEIEVNQECEVPAQDLIDDAERIQKEWAEQFVAPYYDTASDEYKAMIDNTWYGRPEVDVSTIVIDGYMEYSETLNLDYDKIPLRGNQAFLKIHVSETRVLFMPITIMRWLELPDSGNIVVRVYYYQLADGQWFSYDIEEVGY